MTANVKRLRAEYGANTGALGAPEPRLSWHVESDAAGCEQRAYEIAVLDVDTGDTDESGAIESAESVLVAVAVRPARFAGPTASAGTRDDFDGRRLRLE